MFLSDFIQEVQMTTSGVPAQYGGALGGVANVILKKGSNEFHGEIFSNYESSGTDANPVNGFLRYDPTRRVKRALRLSHELHPRSSPARFIRRRRSTSVTRARRTCRWPHLHRPPVVCCGL